MYNTHKPSDWRQTDRQTNTTKYIISLLCGLYIYIYNLASAVAKGLTVNCKNTL